MTADFSEPHEFIHFDHGKLAYYRWGDGPDLVFVHGWPLHGATFRRIIPAIAERYTCHVFDLPGTGKTEWADDAPFGLWEHADTLLDALNKLDIVDYSLLGHDSGGTIARLLATKTPCRVQAIVLGNTEIPGHMPAPLRWAGLLKLPGTVTAIQLVTKSRKAREEMFKSCFRDIAQLDTDFGELFALPFANDREFVKGQLRLVHHLDWDVVTKELGDVHAKIDAPVLLLWGDRDPWFPWKEARSMIDSFAGADAEHVIYEGGRLFIHEEFADRFAADTLEFLDRVV